MRIVLTGGAGYIGSACLRWLIRHGHDPIAYDNLSEGNAAAVPDDRLVVGDIADTDRMVEVMRRHRTEAVMHFAALASVPDSITDPDGYYRVNVIGTKSVLDAMRVAGVARIVFSSTAATYGFHAEMPLREDSPQTPETPYGTTKLAAEWLIKDYARAYNLGYAVLRYFNASGADPDGQNGECRHHEAHLIPLVFQVAIGRREKLLIYGDDWDTRDGTCVRDYVHTEDLAQAHQIAVESLEPGVGLATISAPGPVSPSSKSFGPASPSRDVPSASRSSVGDPATRRSSSPALRGSSKSWAGRHVIPTSARSPRPLGDGIAPIPRAMGPCPGDEPLADDPALPVHSTTTTDFHRIELK